MPKKPTKPEPKSPSDDLYEALEVKKRAFSDLEDAAHGDSPKYVDAYARAANVVRQLEKDRKKDLTTFTDDELIARIKALPERRREAIVTAVQGTSLAGKPIFP